MFVQSTFQNVWTDVRKQKDTRKPCSVSNKGNRVAVFHQVVIALVNRHTQNNTRLKCTKISCFKDESSRMQWPRLTLSLGSATSTLCYKFAQYRLNRCAQKTKRRWSMPNIMQICSASFFGHSVHYAQKNTRLRNCMKSVIKSPKHGTELMLTVMKGYWNSVKY